MNKSILVAASAVYEKDLSAAALTDYCRENLKSVTCETFVVPFIEKLRLSDRILWELKDAELAKPYEDLAFRIRGLIDAARSK